MHKSLLAVIVVSLSSVGQFALADDAVFEGLLSKVQQQVIFDQVTKSPYCPRSITPIESEYRPDDAKDGDKVIYLKNADINDYRSFTHEGNSFIYRPGLKEGKTHVLERTTDFIAGVAMTKTTQQVKDGVLTNERHVNIKSAVMFVKSNRRIRYYLDSGSGVISYRFSAKGIDDVDCLFLERR